MRRTAVPYSFMISPSGEFGIQAERWAPLHATVEGWVESIALAHHASTGVEQITKLVGDDVDGIELNGYARVREVKGLADTWWRGARLAGSPLQRGGRVARLPQGRIAVICSGLDEWGLRGGVDDDG